GSGGGDPLGLGPIPGGRASLGDAPSQRGGRFVPGRRDGGGSGAGAVAAWAMLGLAAVALLALVLRARRRREPVAVEPGLAEFERALRRTRRPLAPSTTLAQLEGRLGPGARRYVAALREQRFTGSGAGPSRDDRRALRRE